MKLLGRHFVFQISNFRYVPVNDMNNYLIDGHVIEGKMSNANLVAKMLTPRI